MNFKILAMGLAISSSLLLSQGRTFAASKSANFNSRITITTACAVAATNMDFGTMSRVLGTETASSTVTVTCNLGTAYAVSLRTTPAATRAVNLRNPAGNTIVANLTLATTAGTSSGTHALKGQLVARTPPQVGLYQSDRIIYVIY